MFSGVLSRSTSDRCNSTCMRVLIVSAGCEAIAANRPPVTDATIVAVPSGYCRCTKLSRSTGTTPRYPHVYSDSRAIVGTCVAAMHSDQYAIHDRQMMWTASRATVGTCTGSLRNATSVLHASGTEWVTAGRRQGSPISQACHSGRLLSISMSHGYAVNAAGFLGCQQQKPDHSRSRGRVP